ncbi:MAG: hypothetical protein GC162_03685 [Planctomycetes bacterium]|nr:hypothetical protein [Planctomycetota bacterium]
MSELSLNLMDYAVRYFGSEMSAGEMDQLNEQLLNSSESRRQFVALCTQVQQLINRGQIKPAGLSADVPDVLILDEPRPIFRRAVAVLAMAAAIALVCGVWLATFSKSDRHDAPATDGPSSSVAMLTNIDGAEFANPQMNDKLGQDLSRGPIELTAGKAQVMFRSTAVVDLSGPCEFEMTGPNRGRLTSGMLQVLVPEAAHGFTVDLPDGSRIVDLGTQFAVRVGTDKRAVVQVLEGVVRLDTPTASQTLRAGWTRRIVDGRVEVVTDSAELLVLPPTPAIDARAFIAAVRALGPIAYWTGGEAVNGQVKDVMSGRPAQALGALAAGGTQSNPNFIFDGHTALSIDNDESLLNPGNRLTLLAWVRLDSADPQAIIHNWSGGNGYTLEIFEGRPAFAVGLMRDGNFAGIADANAVEPMPTKRWVLLAGVYDGAKVRVYIDGRLAGEKAVAEPDLRVFRAAGPVMIGRRSDMEDGYVQGAIDEVAVLNRALSAEDIAGLMRHARDGGSPAAGLEAPNFGIKSVK